jgi:hypothetical protein
MHKWLLVLLFAPTVFAEIGSISELRGIGGVKRTSVDEDLVASLNLQILSYDDVRTGNGRIAIEFLDDSVVRLTEHSSLVIDEFIFDPDPSKSKLALNMASGTARFITGALGKINKENIRINTPTATIAIRGTDFTTTVDEIGRSLVILLPDANGNTSGEITVDSLAGTVVLNQPFQATMVSMSESTPTRPVVLANMTLGFIDNLLIVNQPNEIEQAVEDQQQTSSNVLDADFLEENDLDDDSDLSKDELQEEVTRLDIDLLAVDFLQDLLEIIEDLGQKEEAVSELDGVKLEGIVAGFDQQQQVYSFVDGEILNIFRAVENTVDLELDKSGAYNIEILTAGKQISVTVNGGGENEIVINQSD